MIFSSILIGEKSDDPNHIDYVPTVFAFNRTRAKTARLSLERYERCEKRQRRQALKEPAALEEIDHIPDTNLLETNGTSH